MADAGKYGDVPFEHIPDNEPVFVIRAQDKFALTMLEHYIDLAIRENCSVFFISHLTQVRGDIEFWQRNHTTKLPD